MSNHQRCNKVTTLEAFSGKQKPYLLKMSSIDIFRHRADLTTLLRNGNCELCQEEIGQARNNIRINTNM